MLIEIEHDATIARLQTRQDAVILAVQDTTSFNFSHHPETQGLGVIEDNHSAGFFTHTTLAVSETGVPLGLFDQQVWRRDPSQNKNKRAYQGLPITAKESMKWLNGLAETQSSPAQVIMIADREADIYEVFQQAQQSQTDYVIRATQNRWLAEGVKLYEALEKCPIRATDTIEVPRQYKQEKRVAEVQLRYSHVILLPPQSRPKASDVMALTPLPIQVVEVVERDAPVDIAPIHWILLTTLPVNCLEDAQRIVRFYTYRWLVERFHYVLKSGCRFEESQLKSYDALTRFLALCSHQAWHILELTYQARVTPDAPCDAVLTSEQWQALVAYFHGYTLPTTDCPTFEEACHYLARLGGFIGRKSDRQPGVKVLWRGWQRLQDLAAMWQLFHPPPQDVGNV